MKAYFLFHDVWYQYLKADLVAAQFPFAGFIVVRKTRPWWGAYLWKRARRLGFAKTLDEVLLRLYWLVFRHPGDLRRLRQLLDEVRQRIPAGYRRPPVYRIDDINSDEAVRTLRQLAPDVCVLMCNVILQPKIFTIPPLGMLVFHPGLTPEYRGPHSAFWATLNNEFWGIGWSLLRIDEGIDTGAVLAQGTCHSADPRSESHVVMQHRSYIDGITGVVETLRRLQSGDRPVVDTTGRASNNYTHPGFTDWLRLRRFLAKLDQGAVPAASESERT
jgi:folate-dependent phosphoribosylglycinamide formyltransferase PurN